MKKEIPNCNLCTWCELQEINNQLISTIPFKASYCSAQGRKMCTECYCSNACQKLYKRREEDIADHILQETFK